jgi:putative nucleotidyltransferase with HDIG domain
MNREQALQILYEFTKTDALRKHAYSVEAAMKAYAKKYGEDEELWGSIGLIHDFDYELYPDQHPMKGSKILSAKGVPLEIRNIILGHANFSGVPRETPAAKVLYAVDELCGFIIAVALVRPTRSLSDVNLAAVLKKMKDKRFAAKVNREEIINGARELGVELEQHVPFVAMALIPIASELGLNP